MEGKIMFEKVLTASSLPPFRQLILPARFVSQHGDKIQQWVTLRNPEMGKTWTLKININFPHRRPQAQFCEGWREFVVANNLAIGDRLTFVLVAKSSFDVFIFPRRLSVKKRKLRSQGPVMAHGEETVLSPNGSEKSEITSSGPSFVKETEEETATEALPAQSPSDMDSHSIDPEKEEACIICQVASMEESGMMKVDANFHGPRTNIDE